MPDEPTVKYSKKHQIVAALIIGLFIVGGIAVSSINATDNSTPESDAETERVETVEKEEPTESLSLDVRSNALGLLVENREYGQLNNCEVQVNPGVFDSGYSTRVPIIDSEGAFVAYGDLTKGGERFDYSTTAVESVVVTMCNEDTRIGVYEF